MNEASWTDRPNPEFEQWWATKTKAGYRYGREALENVRFGFEGAQERVRQLEKLNTVLAEQIDRQSAVVDAVLKWKRHKFSLRDLELVVMTYERDMAQLNKGV